MSNIKVSNITLIEAGKVKSVAEVKCPTCGVVNPFKVKDYLGPTGSELRECDFCGAKVAFKWAKE